VRDFVTVCEEPRLPHERTKELVVGHLPCRYVLLVCHRGSPISFAGVAATGVRLDDLRRRAGQPGLVPLLADAPRRLVFDKARASDFARAALGADDEKQRSGGGGGGGGCGSGDGDSCKGDGDVAPPPGLRTAKSQRGQGSVSRRD
jgi:hypothetical protein